MAAKVLVIDDDNFMRQLLRDILGQAGFEVVLARDGVEGCEVAVALQPDIILVDLVMPRMDGAAVCRELRALPQFKHTPLILMTSRADMAASLNPFAIGADDYIAKPFYGQELIARLHGNLSKKRTMLELDRKALDYASLLEMTASFQQPLELAQILRHLGDRISSQLGAVRRCSVALVLEDERCGYLMVSNEDPNLGSLRVLLEHYPQIRQVLQTARPQAEAGDTAVRGRDGAVPSADGFNTTLLLPVLIDVRAIGVMVVRLLRAEAGILPGEENFCQLLVNAAAPALRNAQRFAMVEENSRQLQSAKLRLEKDLVEKAAYEQAFKTAAQGLAAFDGRGRLVLFNRRAHEITGYSIEEAKQRGVIQLLGKERVRQLLPRVATVARDGGAARFDLPLPGRDGSQLLLSVALSGQRRAGGLLLADFRDVTEERRRQAELVEARQGLEQANEILRQKDRSRAEFLNVAAHELRTPVSIIMGYCSMLLDTVTDALSAEQKEHLGALAQGSERLIELVDSLLDISRFEAGKMQMEPNPGNLCALVRELARSFRSLATRSGLEILVDTPREVLASYDHDHMQRVLINLIGNAVKFTQAGGRITIVVAEQGDEVQVSVVDTGKGIPADRAPLLFQEFTQVGREDARRGAGLGLAICKRIVEAHGGRIWLDSRCGSGSCFTFALPRMP